MNAAARRDPLSPAEARRIFLTLTVLRWLPIGFVISLLTLMPLERGLSIAEVTTLSAVTAAFVFALELPTSGIADALGRKPVLVAAACVQILMAAAYLLAHSFWVFVLGAALGGVFRALDSGPLEAWYVDTLQEHHPDADPSGTLAAEGTALGAAIAAGAMLQGLLTWWHPFAGHSALLLPMALWGLGTVVYLFGLLLLLREPRTRTRSPKPAQAAAQLRRVPGVIRDGLTLLTHNKILLCLVLVEVFWGTAMTGFESLTPIRLSEMLGGEDRAGAVMGPVAAGGWIIFAAGAALAGLLSRRIGVVRTAMVSRIFNGVFVVGMGLMTGPVGLIVAYCAAYTMHGTANPPHATLLHREARPENRATVLSMNSMTMFGASMLLAPALGLLAEHTSTATALIVAGAFSILGFALYLPARHAETARLPASVTQFGHTASKGSRT